MVRRVEASIIINKEPHEIYFYLSNFENWRFFSNVKEVELVSGNGGVETIYNIITPTLLGRRRSPVEITKKVAHQLFAFRDTSQPIYNETGFVLSQEGKGQTKITAYQESEKGLLLSVLTLDFLASRDAAISLQKMLKNLKVILEEETKDNSNTVVRHN